MRERLRRSVGLLVGVLLWQLSPPGGAVAQSGDQGPAAGPAVLSIGVVKGKTGTQVTIEGDAELSYEYTVIEGTNLILDIPGASNKVWPAEQPIDDDFVSRVRVSEQAGDVAGVRVVFDLKRPDSFTIAGDQGKIVVTFAKPAAAAPQQAGLNRVTAVALGRTAGAYRLRIDTEAAPAFRVLPQREPGTVVVAVEESALDPAVAGATDVVEAEAPVSRVEVSAEEGPPWRVLVSLNLRRPVPFRAAADGAGVNLDFAPAGAASAGPPPPPRSPEPAAAVTTATEPAAREAASGDYHGSRITLDFVDADITDIFRLIADVSGMNIIASDDVTGKRSVKMMQVPWDQALDLILKTNVPPLVKVVEAENVISVTTLKRRLEDQAAVEKLRLDQLKLAAAEQKQAYESAVAARRVEEEQQAQQLARLKAERQRSKGWLERTFTISYGDTTEIAARLKKYASGCADGCIFEVGERSKSIYVRDFADNVAQMATVFEALEAPTPAVMVEARIVEVQSDYSQALGIQWGARFAADAAHGNATPFTFPNSINVGGTAVQGTDGVNPGQYLVNLPVANATGGVGLTLGHVANTLSLDLKLSALERLGKTKILSNPKVLVVQNEEANINIGSQLPVPRTDAEGNRTIEWKDVGILLQVTPNVTSDGRVFMKLKIEKSAAGETVRTTEGEMFSIERRGATTKVLVGDGETSVIGGIFQQTTADTDDGVPGLSRLPLIGWLFKSKSAANNRKELMIFLTPRITAAREPVGDQARAGAPLEPGDLGGLPLPEPPAAYVAGAVAPAGEPAFGSVRVTSSTFLPRSNEWKLQLSYVNDTEETFQSSATIRCSAFKGGKKAGGNQCLILADDWGPLTPGIVVPKECVIFPEERGSDRVACEVVAAD